MTPRLLISTAACLAATLGAAAGTATAGSHSADHLPTLRAPAASPATIHGTEPKAIVKKGEKLGEGQSLLRVRVSGPAKEGTQLKLTCPSGFVTGYGYRGPDTLAVNGKRILSRHTVRPKVQAASDRNGDGRFTGIVLAFCEGGR